MATVNVHVGTNVAVTDRACVIDTVQLPVPVHAPDQPVNALDPDAVAVNVTDVASSNDAEHVAPQLIPAGLDEIEPDPDPAVTAVNVHVGTNVAVTDRACVIDTTHDPEPVHAPLQPEKTEPVPAVAVNVTAVASLNDAEHVAPQLIPLGLDDTEPLPVPAVVKIGRAHV